jgi:nitroimidazol reductase NimA-like FMN-containing flavoprotein (pyridoxamine 5'-phosphate oxidase superfamily)
MVRKMTPEQREGFLAEVRVGVLSVAAESGRAPLTTPIWYDYRAEGEVIVVTAPGSRKARLISAAGRFTLCVQDVGTPYRYVTVEGPVVEVRSVTEQDRRAMAARYVPAEVVDAYLAATRDDENVVIAMRPDRWITEDYSDIVEQLTV